MMRGALILETQVLVFLNSIAQRFCDPGLADPRFTRQQHQLTFSRLGQFPAIEEHAEFALPTDETGKRIAVRRCKAAFGSRLADYRPRGNRLCKAFQLMRSQMFEREKAANQLPRDGPNDDLPRRRELLQSGGEIGRFACHRCGIVATLADKIADHHVAGRDANSGLESLLSVEVQILDGSDSVQTGPNCPLDLILVCMRPTEIDQDAVS